MSVLFRGTRTSLKSSVRTMTTRPGSLPPSKKSFASGPSISGPSTAKSRNAVNPKFGFVPRGDGK